MITVKDLAKKLRDYALQSPEHAKTEVFIAFDGDVAFPFHGANDGTAMNMHADVKRVLIFMPDIKGDKLEMKALGIALKH